MRELFRTTDVVAVSAVESLLADAGIPCEVFDRHVSVMEGSINAFPLRVMVDPDQYVAARRLLESAGFIPPTAD